MERWRERGGRPRSGASWEWLWVRGERRTDQVIDAPGPGVLSTRLPGPFRVGLLIAHARGNRESGPGLPSGGRRRFLVPRFVRRPLLAPEALRLHPLPPAPGAPASGVEGVPDAAALGQAVPPVGRARLPGAPGTADPPGARRHDVLLSRDRSGGRRPSAFAALGLVDVHRAATLLPSGLPTHQCINAPAALQPARADGSLQDGSPRCRASGVENLAAAAVSARRRPTS